MHYQSLTYTHNSPVFPTWNTPPIHKPTQIQMCNQTNISGVNHTYSICILTAFKLGYAQETNICNYSESVYILGEFPSCDSPQTCVMNCSTLPALMSSVLKDLL